MPTALVAALLVALASSPGASAPGSDAPACNPVPGIPGLLAPGQVVLLGELHGTAEAPRFLGDLVCHALSAGRKVRVGLELPQEDQARVDRFLASDGGPSARAALLSAFWTKSYQDGRTSEAMAGLLERLRGLARSGTLEVILLDRPAAGRGRDEVMASRLAPAASSEWLLVALTGNIHSRTVPGARWDPAYEPMGYLLAQRLPDTRLVSLDMAYTGGTAWVCLSGEPCGEQKLGGRGELDHAAVVLREEPDAHGYHGHFEVGEIHASPPATASP